MLYLLALDLCHLIICYEVASHEKPPIGEITPLSTAVVLNDGNKYDNVSGWNKTGGETPQITCGHEDEPKPGRQFQNMAVDMPRKDLAFAEDDAPDR